MGPAANRQNDPTLGASLIGLGLLLGLAAMIPSRPAPKPPGEMSPFATRGDIIVNPRFPVAIRHGLIEGKVASAEAIDSYWPVFHAEFSLYPASLPAKARVRRVVFCRDLAFSGQKRTALPDFENETLYFDVERGRRQELYLRKVIHHEFFHMVDYADDGLVYGDERWRRLNPASFRYGRGGALAQDDPTTSLPGTGQPGFLNHYSTTGVEEDKAELFAHLLVEPRRVAILAARDPVLASKVERIKELLGEFCPEANAGFWNRAAIRPWEAPADRVPGVLLFSGPR